MDTTAVTRKLRLKGLRLTRARTAISQKLLDGRKRHITAIQLAKELADDGLKFAPATIYNVLDDFAKVGLLRALATNTAVRWYDTDLTPHHHAFITDQDKIIDVAEVALPRLPDLPKGYRVRDLHITYRMEPE